MEYVNKIILAGTVGSVSVSEVAGKRILRFTLATDRAYLDAGNTPVVVTTWFNCKFWESKRCKFPEELKKGDSVSLTGRMDCVRYTGNDGTDRITYEYEVLVASLKVVNKKVKTEKSDL